MKSARRRIESLLVAEATGGLSDAEASELEALLADHPEVDRYAFQRTAAAVFLAVGDASMALPGDLRSRIIAKTSQLLD